MPPGITDIPSPGLDPSPIDADFIEVALLLPRWQAMALQTAARKRGMSAGQMLRRLIGAAVGSQPPGVNL